ncbi:MAG: hypothetical protein HY290_18035 [Planctomycetia bacterium]|nr:hypothetical protein [Planctomycetia bacterium]
MIAQKKHRDAAALLVERERAGSPTTGELLALAIEVVIARWRSDHPEKDAAPSRQFVESLEQRAARLRRDAGGYWALRGELLIRQLQDSQQFGPELAALTGQAQAAFSAGDAAKALDLYGQAAAEARREGRSDLAFQFGYTRASIEVKSQSWDAAAADLLELVEAFPQNSKAPQAHLLAAYARGKMYDAKPTPEGLTAYAEILDAHRTRFLADSTFAEATWMLAELEERRGRSAEALELYRLIPRDHKRAAAAQLAVARMFEVIFDQRRERDEPQGTWDDQAIGSLQKMLPAARQGMTLDLQQAELAIRLARILLRRKPPQFEPADGWLASVASNLSPRETAADPAAPDEADAVRMELRAAARQLQVISLAGQGKFQPARKLLGQLSATSPAELLRILDGLAPLQSDEQGDPFRDLGELQLETALKLDRHRDELSKRDQRRLDECLARGYFAAGKPKQGMEIYDRLLEEFPRDKGLPLAYAGLLTRCRSAACRNRAVAVWRGIESRHEAGSREWYPVRYELCRALLAADQSAEARKLLQVTRLVFPKPENEALQAKFAELEAAATASPGKSK